MKLKVLLFLTLIVVLAIGYYAIFASKKSENIQSPVREKSIDPPAVKKLAKKSLTYEDSSGFKFDYPDSIKIKTQTKTDPDYYTSLELNGTDYNGKLTIDVTATKYPTLNDWIKNNKEIANTAKSGKLGELEAKRIETSGKIMIVSVDLETLFTVTATFPKNEQSFWNETVNLISSSFEFVRPEEEISGQNDSAPVVEDDVVFEGEEVIE